LIQLTFTKKYLEKKGLICEIAYGHQELEDFVDEFDIVHLFNLQTPLTTLRALEIAKTKGKKVCLSTVYFNVYKIVAGVLLSKLRSLSLYRYNLLNLSLYKLYTFLAPPVFNFSSVLNKFSDSPFNPRFYEIAEEILLSVDALLPNSLEELNQITFDFPSIPSVNLRNKTYIVKNGVDCEEIERFDEECVSASVKDLIKQLKIKHKFIIGEVGRIEEIKNQNSLVKAFCGKEDFAVVLAGMYRESDSYYKNIKQMVRKCKNIYLVGPLSRCDTIFLMRNLDVHALPSLRESPGLVVLEAASLGTPVVTTMYSPINEYLNNFAFVCNPLDINDIREKVMHALRMPEETRVKMKRHVLSNLTWERAANETLYVYKELLSK